MIDFKELKKVCIYSLIGSLIISAIVAVISVLVGSFNEITTKAFLTLLMVVIHSVIVLSFIWDDNRQKDFERLSFFINFIFILVIVSFITSVFGVWEVLKSDNLVNLYQTYFVLAFAVLHGEILSKALKKEGYLDKIIYFNYLFILVVVSMLIMVIFTEVSYEIFGPFFFRILAASAIIDCTLSILTIIFFKLYMSKHPEVANDLSPLGEKKSRGFSIFVWILIIYLLIQVIGSFFVRSLF